MSISDLAHEYYGDQNARESDSITSFGAVSDPAAGAAITTTASLPVGTWDIACYTNLSGTTAGADRPNLSFQVGTTARATILSTLGGITDRFDIRINLTAASTVRIIAIVAGTTGSVYRATIVANKMGI